MQQMEERPANAKGIEGCDDCYYQGKCHSPIVRDGITYFCLIDEDGEWIE